MLPEEKYERDVWYVLKKIKERSLYTETGKPIIYFAVTGFSDFSNLDNLPPTPADQVAVLKKLKEDGALKILTDERAIEESCMDIEIEIIQPAFDQHYGFHYIFTDSVLKAENEKLKEIQNKPQTNIVETIINPKLSNLKKSIKPDQFPELYLNDEGDFWREPKNKYCYSMIKKSDRHKIVRYLIANNGYQQTSDISLALEGKKEQSIRMEIARIRGNIKKFLKINGKQVIEAGRKGSGYRVNPNYRIKLKK